VQPHIRPLGPKDTDGVVRLSLEAWTPVFASMRQALGPEIFGRLYHDWRVSQREAVEAACTSDKLDVWVADVDDACCIGYVAIELHRAKSVGEIFLLAVDPDHQGRGVGSALTEFALGWIKSAGMGVSMVETGGDPGHAAARHTYEKAGYTQLPIARYFKSL
jgi:GNAT superfamily N-acetyltransferase